MKPKTTDDIIKSLEKMKPYTALAHANKYKLPEVVKIFQVKVKPINDKLIQDSKKYSKKNLGEFVDFVCTWMDEQGGQSYDIYDTFADIMNKLSDRVEEDVEMEDDEGNHTYETNTEESYYGDSTIKSFKQLLINYVIDELSNTVYQNDEEEYEEDPDAEGYDYDMVPAEEVTDEQLRREVERIRNERLEREKKENEKKPINKIKKFLGFNKKEEDKK
jgi:hypothetical protein